MKLLRFALYPFVFLGCVTTLVALLARGAPYAIVGPAVLLVSASIVTVLERAMPHARAWTHDLGDQRTDLWHLAHNGSVISPSATPSYTALNVSPAGPLV